MRVSRLSDLRGGDELILSRAASVQFLRPVPFRLIRVLPTTTYDGWCWLDGYELDPGGEAVERRRLFVQYQGVIKRERPGKPRAETQSSGPAASRPEPLTEKDPAMTINARRLPAPTQRRRRAGSGEAA